MGALLLCVAFLGAHAEREETYGPSMDIGAPLELPPGDEGAHTEHDHQAPASTDSSAVTAAPAPCAKPTAPPVSHGILPDGRIVLNDASKEDFTKLPGVGDSRAEAIVQLRERMGKFRSVNDLLRVRGIGWKTLQTLKDLIVVDRPKEESAPKEESVPKEEASDTAKQQSNASRGASAPMGQLPS